MSEHERKIEHALDRVSGRIARELPPDLPSGESRHDYIQRKRQEVGRTMDRELEKKS